MTDIPPSRKITGLAPSRQVDLSRLMERNRSTAPVALVPPLVEEAPATPPAAEPEPVRAAETPPPVAAVAARVTQAPRKPAARPDARTEPTEEPKAPSTIYLTESVRQRAQAAWKATGYLQGEDSWSDFVGTAVLKELQLREKNHNGGEPFAAVGRLRPGRPLKN